MKDLQLVGAGAGFRRAQSYDIDRKLSLSDHQVSLDPFRVLYRRSHIEIFEEIHTASPLSLEDSPDRSLRILSCTEP